MARINILDDNTINKIAAGEVIERPASIIKELVENSIDAGSKNITVEIKNGGKDFIKIIDDGSGIDADDINKAFMRHATSKIKRAEDLSQLLSLGFRGEALASISAVSKIDMKTKTEDAIIATEVKMEGGKIISKEPASANRGTQITVRELFFNTPARRKFLKSNQAESMAITDLINKIAIGNPSVKIKYINNSKTVFETVGDGKLYNVVRMIYGKDISDNLIGLNYQSPYFSVKGFIANNNVYRSNKSLQHVYINGRYVKSDNISKAVNDAYKAIIPINRYAICFIMLEIDPSSIDVNIHPSKLEVKFDNEENILSDLTNHIRGTLLKNSLVGRYKEKDSANSINDFHIGSRNSSGVYHSFSYSPKEQVKNEKKTWAELFRRESVSIEDIDKNRPEKTASENEKNSNVYLENKREISDFRKPEDMEKNISDSEHIADFKKPYNSDPFETNIPKNILDPFDLKKADICAEPQENLLLSSEKKEQIQMDIYEKRKNSVFENLIFTGIIFDTYVIFTKNDNMYLLDQHAAHERIRFEMYMKKFRSNDISIQMLIEPVIMELSPNDMEITLKNIDVFERFGFLVEEFGHKNISIRGLPNTFGRPESERFIYELIDNLGRMDSIYDTKYDEIAEIACKSAIKANDRISREDAINLINELDKCDNPYTCPHGRPVMVKMTKYEIEKMFKRKM